MNRIQTPGEPQKCPIASRRDFLAAASGLAAGAMLGRTSITGAEPPASPTESTRTVPFWGEHQAGILTPAQTHTCIAAFDLLDTARRDDLIQLLRDWTRAAAAMTRGESVELRAPEIRAGDTKTLANNPDYPAPSPLDSGETLGLSPAGLTLTFGLGATLFTKAGHDRFGLASKRPEALGDLPRFSGDQLDESRSGGDLSVQACADDAQVVFHAIRQLTRLTDGIAQIRWMQNGFLPQTPGDQSPRNLMGFKDGTNNPSTTDPAMMKKFVWAGESEPAWMRNGTYLVVRRIRIAIEHWDRMSLAFQEQTVGRSKRSGALLGKKNESDPVNLDLSDADGNPVIPDNAHIRLASPDSNNGARILRRSYSYNDGVNFTSERWPPWRQGMEYDAGLLFLAYQSDPRTGFIKIFDPMSRLDMLNQFVTHTASGLFAILPGAREGEYIGQRLFETP
jgi:deferrochelatase/peroxidase EfeB